MQTIISEGMLPQRFDSSASCGARRDCLRYPNHEGFKRKLRCRFLMSWLDVSDGLAFATLSSTAFSGKRRAETFTFIHRFVFVGESVFAVFCGG